MEHQISQFDWLTLGIAVAGFVLSSAIWVKELLSQRRRLAGRILGINMIESTMYFDLLLENRSRLPISVTQLELLYNGNLLPCCQIPKIVSEHTRKSGTVVIDRIIKRSAPLPISLSSLGACEAIILFERLPKPFPSDATELKLQVSTNRGSPFEMSLALPAGWKNQRTIL